MKISKLYLKILLVFVPVLVVADVIAFLIIISDEMPSHRMRRFTDKMDMARTHRAGNPGCAAGAHRVRKEHHSAYPGPGQRQ